MDLDKELYALIKLVANVSDAYTASFFWLDPEGKALVLRSVHTLSKYLKRDTKIELGSALIGWVGRQGETANVSYFSHDPKTLQLYSQEENIKSFLAIPIKVGADTKGVLCIDSKKSYIQTPQLEKVLTEFADYFGQIMERYSGYQVVKEQANGYVHLYNLYKELNGFHKDNIFDLLINISRQLCEFDTCILSTLDNDNRNLVVRVIEGNASPQILAKKYSAQDGIAGLLMRTKNPIKLSELQSRSTPFFVFSQDDPFQNIASFMGLPLLVNDEAVGFLGFASKKPQAFGERDLQLASILSFQASSAVSLARAHAQVLHRDKVDSLTGLATHSFLHCQLEQAFLEADKHTPFSLMLLDIDGFTPLNKKYGYQVGDELLKKVANILLGLVRDDDVVARFGGEEFCILLKSSPCSRANSVAERIRQIIQQTVFLVNGMEIKLTVSVGVAGYLEHAFSKEELLHCAKSALAQAKKTKNSVCNI